MQDLEAKFAIYEYGIKKLPSGSYAINSELNHFILPASGITESFKEAIKWTEENMHNIMVCPKPECPGGNFYECSDVSKRNI